MRSTKKRTGFRALLTKWQKALPFTVLFGPAVIFPLLAAPPPNDDSAVRRQHTVAVEISEAGQVRPHPSHTSGLHAHSGQALAVGDVVEDTISFMRRAASATTPASTAEDQAGDVVTAKASGAAPSPAPHELQPTASLLGITVVGSAPAPGRGSAPGAAKLEEGQSMESGTCSTEKCSLNCCCMVFSAFRKFSAMFHMTRAAAGFQLLQMRQVPQRPQLTQRRSTDSKPDDEEDTTSQAKRLAGESAAAGKKGAGGTSSSSGKASTNATTNTFGGGLGNFSGNGTQSTESTSIGEEAKIVLLSAADFVTDVTGKAILIACFLPLAGLLVAFGLEKSVNAKKPQGKQRAGQSKADQEREEAIEEIHEYLLPNELTRLGGADDILITKITGVSTGSWVMFNALSLALFSATVDANAEMCICVLGASGRLLTMHRKPIMDMRTAGRLMVPCGVTISMLIVGAYVFSRFTLRALQLAAMSDDPAVRRTIDDIGPMKKKFVATPQIFTPVCGALAWICYFLFLKTRIRTWGPADEKNYYESKEACCGQYFRAGARGIIPCANRMRRRQGGMRIFFGPYPEKSVFQHLGTGFKTMQNLLPLVWVPAEAGNNGYPPTGGSQPLSDEDKAGAAQFFLAFINLVLGGIGLAIFWVHLTNFGQNLQACPTSKTVMPCVEHGACTRVAKSPWFEQYMMTHKIWDTDDLAKHRQISNVDANTLGIWLKKGTTEEAQSMVFQIAESACHEAYLDLVKNANHSLDALQADSIGKFNTKNYVTLVDTMKYNVTWEPDKMQCTKCTRLTSLRYYSNFENMMEIVEIILLIVTCYIQSMLYKFTMGKIENCPMIDMPFTCEPGVQDPQDVQKIENQALSLLGLTFFHRYKDHAVPPHIEALEKACREAREAGLDTSKLPDPWSYDTTAKGWNEYNLVSVRNPRHFLVNKALLGLLQGEEVVSAWSETPRLNTAQKIIVYGGLLFWLIAPIAWARAAGQPRCIIEAFVALAVHFKLCEFFIMKRRPQAGFILTSRRLFQVTRLPAFKDLFGMTEPLLKLDVLIHNSLFYYSSMTMEAYVPCWRRHLNKMMKLPIYRRGHIVCSGASGVFQIYRDLGDVKNCFMQLSKTVLTAPVEGLTPGYAEPMIAEELACPEEIETPEACCACICCPKSPEFEGGLPLVERYVERKRKEKDIYQRKLQIRPVTCRELCCGRFFNVELSFCWCCQLDEVATDFVVTNQRVLVEQRALQRYCRLFSCCRLVPNIRVTWMVHQKAAAYLAEKTSASWGFSKVRQDLCVKLLNSGGRHYLAGLMLYQRPYKIVNQDSPTVDKLWVTNICQIYDKMTQRVDYEMASSDEDDDNKDDDDDEVDYDD